MPQTIVKDVEEGSRPSRVVIKSHPTKHPSKLMLRKNATPLGVSQSNGNDNSSLLRLPSSIRSPLKIGGTGSSSTTKQITNSPLSKPMTGPGHLAGVDLSTRSSIRVRSASLSPIRSAKSIKTTKVRPPWDSSSPYSPSQISKSVNGSPSGSESPRTVLCSRTTASNNDRARGSQAMRNSMVKTISGSSPSARAAIRKESKITNTSVGSLKVPLVSRPPTSRDPLFYIYPRESRKVSPSLCDKPCGMEIESKVQTLINLNKFCKQTHPARLNKSPKSVRWNPSVVFCEPQIGKNDLRQESLSQDSVQNILETVSTLKGVNRLQFQILLDALKHIDSNEMALLSKGGETDPTGMETLEKINAADSAIADYAAFGLRGRPQSGEQSENYDDSETSSYQDSPQPPTSNEQDSFLKHDGSLGQINQDRLFDRMRLFQQNSFGADVTNSAELDGSATTSKERMRSSGLTDIEGMNAPSAFSTHGLDISDSIFKAENQEKMRVIKQYLTQRRRCHQNSSDVDSFEVAAMHDMPANVHKPAATPSQTLVGLNSPKHLEILKKVELETFPKLYCTNEAQNRRTESSHGKELIPDESTADVGDHKLYPSAPPCSWLQDSYFCTRRNILGRERSTMSVPEYPNHPDHPSDCHGVEHRKERSTVSALEPPSQWDRRFNHGEETRPYAVRCARNHTPSRRQLGADTQRPGSLYQHSEPRSRFDQPLGPQQKYRLDRQVLPIQNYHQPRTTTPSHSLASVDSQNRCILTSVAENHDHGIKSGDLIKKETDRIIRHFSHLAKVTMNMNVIVLRGQSTSDQSWRELARLTLQPPDTRPVPLDQEEAGSNSQPCDPLRRAVVNLNRIPTKLAPGNAQKPAASVKLDPASNASDNRGIKQQTPNVRLTHRFKKADCAAPSFVPQVARFKNPLHPPIPLEIQQQSSFWARAIEQHLQPGFSYSPFAEPYPVYMHLPYGPSSPYTADIMSWTHAAPPKEWSTAEILEREATALPASWANSLVDNFKRRYPMTGAVRTHPLIPPGFESPKGTPHNVQVPQPNSVDKRAAEIQQELELLLLRKKEKGARTKSTCLGKTTESRRSKSDFKQRISYEQSLGLTSAVDSYPELWMGHYHSGPSGYWI
jgi:hypothetical protein